MQSFAAARSLPAFLLLVLAASCAGQPAGAPIARLDLEDLEAPAMFEHVQQQLRHPYVLELAPWPVNERFDLHLEHTHQRDVLAALARLDPRFQYELAERVATCWPTGPDGDDSPFARRVLSFQADTGAAEAIRNLLQVAGLDSETDIQAEGVGAHRPVRIDAKDLTVRELLAEIAAQAHLGMRNEPGHVRSWVVPE